MSKRRRFSPGEKAKIALEVTKAELTMSAIVAISAMLFLCSPVCIVNWGSYRNNYHYLAIRDIQGCVASM